MSDTNEPIIYCANHPGTPTTLRCNRCEKPICPKCAVLTPTGYRCNECVRSQQKTFDTALWYDYILAFVIGGFLSYIGSLVVRYIGFFTIFLAPIAGVIIAEAIRAAVRRRRSKRLFQLATLAVALGGLPALILLILGALVGGGMGGFLLPLIWQGLYIVTAVSTTYYRLSGIQIGR
jgi:MFS family permease